ncbi:hypothetical protein SPRG_16019 [Saprolegnia parasitica CBS 223.65]|uniref:Major facilitator superfamily associated domain-containing protein n=1 Tax=Saprolegnia parasitica (strain CBS 223.65) TaxID=695850 RepID=A0A067BVP3_SAPPC|nr:hypothetical protein SPRG_16019 [Saprolegnia parasitica CBS 223.65]KDO18662.1 hypothetical protein SPRG_16019 [Saprolegnia parasitica CBS 223.65]|eukprot:XP_012210626.1 hypothetical protein SPRG_16019 [Saprolegnia parasitica CBS 223.65]
MSASPITIMESSHLGYLKPYEIFVDSSHGDIYSNAWRGQKARTPQDDFEGPLRDGSPVDLFSAAHAGLLVSAGVLGMVTTLLTVLAAPGPGHAGLVNLGFYARVLFALTSDSVPFLGYKRKSYMLLGWASMAVAFFVLSIVARDGDAYAAAVVLASLSAALVQTASDGLMVEYAQREPIEARGRTQITLLALNWFGASLSSLLLACLTDDASGDVTWALDKASVLRIVAVICILPVPALLFFITESRLAPSLEFRRRRYMFGRLLQNKAIWQVALFQAGAGCCLALSSVANGYSPLLWFRTIYPWIVRLVFFVLFAYALAYVQRRGLSWHWQRSFLSAASANMLLHVLQHASVVDDATNWGAVTLVWVSSVPTAIQYVLRHLPMVEVAPYGFEATTLSLLSTSAEIVHPLMMALHQHYAGPDGRWSTLTFYIALGLNVVGCLSVWFLPKQRSDCILLRHFGGLSKLAAWLLFTALVLHQVAAAVLQWPGSSLSRL